MKNQGLGIEGLRAGVRRLRSAASAVLQPCASCRLIPLDPWPRPGSKEAESGDLIKVVCEFCGSESACDLKWYSERDGEIKRLQHSFTSEDGFTNPVARAVELWRSLRPEVRNYKFPRAALGAMAKKDPAARLYLRLWDEFLEMCRLRRKRLENRYGKDPFPDLKRLVEEAKAKACPGQGLYRREDFELLRDERDLLVCAELEKFIFGRVWPETEAEIEDVRGKIAARVEEERVKEENWQEEMRRSKERYRELTSADQAQASATPPSEPPAGAEPVEPAYDFNPPDGMTKEEYIKELEEMIQPSILAEWQISYPRGGGAR